MRDQQRVGIGLGDIGGLQIYIGGRRREALDGGDMAVIVGDDVAESLGHAVAIGILRNEGREILPPLGRGIGHDVANFVFGLETEQVDTLARHRAIGREGQYRHTAVARDGRHRRHRCRKQGPHDHLGPLREQFAGGLCCICGPRTFIGGDQQQVRVRGIRNRHLGGVQHRIGQRAGGGRTVGERQHQPHTHRRMVLGRVAQAQEARQVAAQLMGCNLLGRGDFGLRRSGGLGAFGLATRKGRYRNSARDGTNLPLQTGKGFG